MWDALIKQVEESRDRTALVAGIIWLMLFASGCAAFLFWAFLASLKWFLS